MGRDQVDRSGTDAHVGVGDVLASGAPVTSYQPIVDIAAGRRADGRFPTVAFEALSRWPGLPDVGIEALFADARPSELRELDWACRVAALEGAVAAGVGRETAIFLNAEPAASLMGAPKELRVRWRRAIESVTVVVELTERHILTRPAELLEAVRVARRRGWLIAMDDIGANPDSLAVMEFLRPDILKLDLNLIRSALAGDRARTLMAVAAYTERTGATVLAEGIETDEHLERASSLGATLAQGYLFGVPGPLAPADRELTVEPVPRRAFPISPFALLAGRADVREASKEMVIALTRDIEQQAGNLVNSPVVLASFQSADRFGGRTRDRYVAMAERSPLVVVLAVDMPSAPGPGVRGARLEPDDPLADDWTVVVVSAHYTAALIAHDLGDGGPDAERRFRYVLTHDRDTVVAAGRSLMSRLVSPGPRD